MSTQFSNFTRSPHISGANSTKLDNFEIEEDPIIVIYWLLNISGSTIGLLSNALLIRTIYKTSGRPIQPYSYLFLFSAVFDLLFSFVEMVTQHVSLLIGREFRMKVRPGC